jgi:hypothetical protein
LFIYDHENLFEVEVLNTETGFRGQHPKLTWILFSACKFFVVVKCKIPKPAKFNSTKIVL